MNQVLWHLIHLNRSKAGQSDARGGLQPRDAATAAIEKEDLSQSESIVVERFDVPPIDDQIESRP